ncbi:hypothetical protein ACPUER_03480 [Burkholderia sp. DN3021]|uniref:hypothetical protein n=1 Tax=Burkholderia TaxID=32008 RepID=UPI00158D3029|nr:MULTISPECIES: hypothetical protein [Burkholderia cepacia complex]MDR6497020.1 hypothetical protein [Burkholderia ambifaria]
MVLMRDGTGGAEPARMLTVGLPGMRAAAMREQASGRYRDGAARPTNRFAFAYRRAADKLSGRRGAFGARFRAIEPGSAARAPMRRMRA